MFSEEHWTLRLKVCGGKATCEDFEKVGQGRVH